MSDFDTDVIAPPPPSQPSEIIVSKSFAAIGNGNEVEVYTMTLGGETIDLLPLRNWSQLDVYKWRARGKLPGTPAGLEITFDHVKVAGETVSTKDPAGPMKLQKLLNEWLAFARGPAASGHQPAHSRQTPAELEASGRPEDRLPCFHVEVDKEGQVHIICIQGKQTLAKIGLNPAGFSSLINQGLMHKPHTLQVGALHDWVQLDSEFFSFEKGNNDSSKLEQALNGRYRCTEALGQGKDVVVFTNAASPTGFDIQFAAKVGGVTDHRRRPLNEESLNLLQATDRCGLLPKDLVIKLSPPSLIFKRKTPDGGERYLDEGADTTLTVIGDDGEVKIIALSRPVNYLRLTALDLTALFNHPAINQHSRVSPQPGNASAGATPAQVAAPPAAERPIPLSTAVSPPNVDTKPVEVPKPKAEVHLSIEPAIPVIPKPAKEKPAAQPDSVIRPLPNLWMKSILDRPSVRHDWFTCLIYRKMAEHFGNSHEAMFGPIPCWASSLGDVDDVCDPAFHGVFLTQKGGLAYLNQGHIVRFRNKVAFIGTLESAIEGIGVDLKAVGADAHQRLVFIVTEGYYPQFGVSVNVVAEELARLRKYGASVVSANEALQSPDPIEVVWTVPDGQENASDPQALEDLRPGSIAADGPVEEGGG